MSAAETRNVTIRLATPADAAELARLRFELRSSLHQTHEVEAVFRERCGRWMSDRLRDDRRWRCWIAEADGAVAGAVWVQLIEKIPNPIAAPEQYVYLTNFYVLPERRGLGVGTQLLSEALAWSRSREAELVLLWPTEKSKRLYERHGFVTAEDFMELVL